VSLSALLQAVRDQLRKEVPLKVSECDIQPDGQPPPGIGRQYVAVHPTGWENDIPQMSRGLSELYAISVTLTMRAPESPRDRIMSELYLKALKGMESIIRRIIIKIHDNYTVLISANKLIDGDDKIVEPLRWASTDAQPRMVGPEWLFSAEEGFKGTAALVMESRFITGRRIQSHTNME